MKNKSLNSYMNLSLYEELKAYIRASSLKHNNYLDPEIVFIPIFGLKEEVHSTMFSINNFQEKYKVNNIGEFIEFYVPNMSFYDLRATALAISEEAFCINKNSYEPEQIKTLFRLLNGMKDKDVCCLLSFSDLNIKLLGNKEYFKTILNVRDYNLVELGLVLRLMKNYDNFEYTVILLRDLIAKAFSKINSDNIIQDLDIYYWLASLYFDLDNSVLDEDTNRLMKNLSKLINTNINSIIAKGLDKYGIDMDTSAALNFLFQSISSNISNAFANYKKDKLIKNCLEILLLSKNYHCITEDIVSKYGLHLVEFPENAVVKDIKWLYSIIKSRPDVRGIVRLNMFNKSDIINVLEGDDLKKAYSKIDIDEKTFKNEDSVYIIKTLSENIMNKHNSNLLFSKLSYKDITKDEHNETFLENLSLYLDDLNGQDKVKMFKYYLNKFGCDTITKLPHLFDSFFTKIINPYSRNTIDCIKINNQYLKEDDIYLVYNFLLDSVLMKAPRRFLEVVYFLLMNCDLDIFEYNDIISVVEYFIECEDYTQKEKIELINKCLKEDDIEKHMVLLNEDNSETGLDILSLENLYEFLQNNENIDLDDSVVLVDNFREEILYGDFNEELAYDILNLLLERDLIDEIDYEDLSQVIGEVID